MYCHSITIITHISNFVTGILDVAIGAAIASDMQDKQSEIDYIFPAIWLFGTSGEITQ